jgi:F-type H+-transporting ATPase subunit epsilon
MMRLLVTTPLDVVVDAPDVTYVRAEDASGAFGILDRHADLVTVLIPSVVSWRDSSAKDHHIAVLGGVLMVSGGRFVEIASRQAVGEDELSGLESAVLKRFAEETSHAEETGATAARLHTAMMYQIQRYLDAGRKPGAYGMTGSTGFPRVANGAEGSAT